MYLFKQKAQNNVLGFLFIVTAVGLTSSFPTKLRFEKEMQLKYFQASSIILVAFHLIRDHGGIWTHTPLRAPPPQDGKSTVSPRGLK